MISVPKVLSPRHACTRVETGLYGTPLYEHVTELRANGRDAEIACETPVLNEHDCN